MTLERLKELFKNQLQSSPLKLYFFGEADGAVQVFKVDADDLQSLIGKWEVSQFPGTPDMPRLAKV